MCNCVRETELRVAASGDRGRSREVQEWPLLLFSRLPCHEEGIGHVATGL